MNFFKALFGGAEQTAEEESKEREDKNFDLLKYDGVKAMRMGRFDYAQKCFEEALKLRDDMEVHDYLAQALLRMGELEQAGAQYQLLSEAEPENVAVLLQMAHVAYMLEDYDTMETVCQKALLVDKENVHAQYQMAQAYIGKSNPVAAVAVLTAAIAQHPDAADAYLLRGQTLLRMGDVLAADKDAMALLDMVSDQEDVLMLKARVEAAKGNGDEALGWYDKVVTANPFSVEAYQERGQIKFEKGDTKGAKEDADKVLELNPQQLADVSGDYSAEGIERKTRQAYSNVNPFGI